MAGERLTRATRSDWERSAEAWPGCRPRLRQLPRLVHRGPVLVRRPNSTKAQVHTAVGQSSCDASSDLELSPKAGAHRRDNALVPDGVPRHSDRAASIRLQAQPFGPFTLNVGERLAGPWTRPSAVGS